MPLDGNDSSSNELFESRNEHLKKKGIKIPKINTNTCVAGIRYDEGIILAADSLVTSKKVKLPKNLKKIHSVADNIYVAAIGMLPDIDYLMTWVTSQLSLYPCESQVATCMISREIYRFGEELLGNFIVGGIDRNVPYLATVSEDSTIDVLPHAAYGSGDKTIDCYMEMHWKPNLSRDEAEEIIINAVKRGMASTRDSGSYIDLTTLSNHCAAKHKQVLGKPLQKRREKRRRRKIDNRGKINKDKHSIEKLDAFQKWMSVKHDNSKKALEELKLLIDISVRQWCEKKKNTIKDTINNDTAVEVNEEKNDLEVKRNASKQQQHGKVWKNDKKQD